MADQTYALKNDASTTVATWVIDVVPEGSVPVSKIMLGDDDTNDGFVSSANPLPVTGTITAVTSITNAVTVSSHDVTNAGTFAVQAAQSGTWTVDLGATDNAVLDAIAASLAGTLTVDGSGVTQPVSAVSLPLPSGASTAAKQPALGTAGTASSDVITVQGIASMTALVVDGSGVTQPISASSLPLPSGASTAANQATANGLLTTIDSDTGSIATDIATVAGAVSGTEMQVDIVSGSISAVGADAEDAAVTSNPVLVAGRYDATERTLDDGDVGALAVDDDGVLLMKPHTEQSSGNTTTTPLGAGATFTGTGEQNQYTHVMVSCYSDQAGTLYFDFSPDGTNWNVFPVAGFSVAAATHEFHMAVKGPRYFRVRYTDGGSGQSTFRLYTYYGQFNQANAPLNTDIAQDSDAAVVHAVLAAQINGSGDFVNIQSTSSGILKIGGSVDVDSSALPTGAAIASKQPALGTAGSASTDVITVQGIASMTALVVDGSGVTQPVSMATLPDTASNDLATLNFNSGIIGGALTDSTYVDDEDWTALTSSHWLIGGVYQSTPGTITDGDTGPFRVNQNGALHIDGTATTQPVSASSLPLPSGAATAANQSTANGLLTTIDADTGSISTNMATVAGAVSGTEMQVDIVSGTVTANLSATDNTVLDNIDTNTSASTSHYRNVDANAEAAIKGSAGVLHWMHVMNMTAAVAYLHLYDATAASVTPGTTTPTYTFPIPTAGDTNGAGFNLPLGPNGQSFSNAITMVVTTTIDGSAGDPGTNGVFVNAGYE